MQSKQYVVAQEGWVLGEFRNAGESVTATEEEAKYLLMSGNIAELPEEAGALEPTVA